MELVGKVRDLLKKFGDFTAVAGIDFDVFRGEIFGFLGPNGSGKTTTIRMMLGLLPPTAGSVEVLGIPVIDQPQLVRPRVGYMSQRFSLYNDLTVRENLTFYARSYGIQNHQLGDRIVNGIRLAGLEGRENAKTGELAGGWRQRLALAASIMHEPELVFLDEPTAGVDPVSRRAFWDLLYDLISEGITVFVTTHYMDEAEHCHRLALLQRGRIIHRGSPSEIKAETLGGQILEFEPDNPSRTVDLLREERELGRLDLEEVALYGSRVHVLASDLESLVGKTNQVLTQAGIDPGEMTLIEPSLEDVFIASMNRDDLERPEGR
jgi:ABC-2 type transport system ATP-binding protein